MAVGALRELGGVFFVAINNLATATPRELEIRGTLDLGSALLDFDGSEESDQPGYNCERQG